MLKSLLPYIQLMRLDRPIGTFLLLWPTLWALWLAGNGQPDPDIVVIFVLGTILMRAAGCIINDYADREFDLHVTRTRTRPLATGTVSVRAALCLFASLVAASFILVLQLNLLTIGLSFAALLIVMIYPYCKRFTHLPQCVLGLAFSMGIPMSYAALTNSVPAEAVWLFVANFFWIIAYDTLYAMADRDDDLVIGIKSTAILFGQYDKLIVGILHIITFAILYGIGIEKSLSWHFFGGLGCAALFAVYQQYLCKDRHSDRCLTAFLNNSWVGAMVYCGILLGTISR